MPLLRQTTDLGRDNLIPGLRINRVNYYRPWKETRGDINVVMRQNQWKSIWNQELESAELYDIEQDPAERVDLSSKHIGLAKRMVTKSREWYEECRSKAQEREEIGEMDEETLEELRALGYID